KYPNIIIKPISYTPEIPILELKILKNRISILEDTNKLILQRLEFLEQAQPSSSTLISESSCSFDNSEEQRHFQHLLEDS
ncbi:hypothetical protein OFB74_35020, partial [Escherichia coli]|nr:hypothetical protein [Escherichia coli]